MNQLKSKMVQNYVTSDHCLEIIEKVKKFVSLYQIPLDQEYSLESQIQKYSYQFLGLYPIKIEKLLGIKRQRKYELQFPEFYYQCHTCDEGSFQCSNCFKEKDHQCHNYQKMRENEKLLLKNKSWAKQKQILKTTKPLVCHCETRSFIPETKQQPLQKITICRTQETKEMKSVSKLLYDFFSHIFEIMKLLKTTNSKNILSYSLEGLIQNLMVHGYCKNLSQMLKFDTFVLTKDLLEFLFQNKKQRIAILITISHQETLKKIVNYFFKYDIEKQNLSWRKFSVKILYHFVTPKILNELAETDTFYQNFNQHYSKRVEFYCHHETQNQITLMKFWTSICPIFDIQWIRLVKNSTFVKLLSLSRTQYFLFHKVANHCIQKTVKGDLNETPFSPSLVNNILKNVFLFERENQGQNVTSSHFKDMYQLYFDQVLSYKKVKHLSLTSVRQILKMEKDHENIKKIISGRWEKESNEYRLGFSSVMLILEKILKKMSFLPLIEAGMICSSIRNNPKNRLKYKEVIEAQEEEWFENYLKKNGKVDLFTLRKIHESGIVTEQQIKRVIKRKTILKDGFYCSRENTVMSEKTEGMKEVTGIFDFDIQKIEDMETNSERKSLLSLLLTNLFQNILKQQSSFLNQVKEASQKEKESWEKTIKIIRRITEKENQCLQKYLQREGKVDDGQKPKQIPESGTKSLSNQVSNQTTQIKSQEEEEISIDKKQSEFPDKSNDFTFKLRAFEESMESNCNFKKKADVPLIEIKILETMPKEVECWEPQKLQEKKEQGEKREKEEKEEKKQEAPLTAEEKKREKMNRIKQKFKEKKKSNKFIKEISEKEETEDLSHLQCVVCRCGPEKDEIDNEIMFPIWTKNHHLDIFSFEEKPYLSSCLHPVHKKCLTKVDYYNRPECQLCRTRNETYFVASEILVMKAKQSQQSLSKYLEELILQKLRINNNYPFFTVLERSQYSYMLRFKKKTENTSKLFTLLLLNITDKLLHSFLDATFSEIEEKQLAYFIKFTKSLAPAIPVDLLLEIQLNVSMIFRKEAIIEKIKRIVMKIVFQFLIVGDAVNEGRKGRIDTIKEMIGDVRRDPEVKVFLPFVENAERMVEDESLIFTHKIFEYSSKIKSISSFEQWQNIFGKLTLPMDMSTILCYRDSCSCCEQLKSYYCFKCKTGTCMRKLAHHQNHTKILLSLKNGSLISRINKKQKVSCIYIEPFFQEEFTERTKSDPKQFILNEEKWLACYNTFQKSLK